MITSLLYCLTVAWTACPGTTAGHYLFVDDVLSQTLGPELEAGVCFEDQEPHIVKVQCFDANGNVGEMSDGSDAIQRVIVPPLDRLPVVVRADLDGNGVVDFPDFLLFGGVYGKHNDGIREQP